MIRTAPWSLKLAMGVAVAALAVPAVVFFMKRDANAFNNGTLDLATAPESALVTFAGMVSGDTVTNPLVISNHGTETLRYSVGSSATNDDRLGLKDQQAAATTAKFTFDAEQTTRS